MSRVHAHAIGAANEMIVCGDLLKRGYFVYHQVSRGSRFDLVMSDGKKLWRVEVATAAKTSEGKILCNYQCRDRTRFDVIAWVLPDNSIRYAPNLESLEDL